MECGSVDAGYGGVGAGVGHGEAAGGGGGEGDGAVGEREVEVLIPDDGLLFARQRESEGIVVVEGDDGHAVICAVVEMKVAEVLWRSDGPAQTKVASVVNGGPIELPCMVSRDSHRFHQRAISGPMLDKIANRIVRVFCVGCDEHMVFMDKIINFNFSSMYIYQRV